jgi:hypothetical protein
MKSLTLNIKYLRMKNQQEKYSFQKISFNLRKKIFENILKILTKSIKQKINI